jgi:hypothetical protein
MGMAYGLVWIETSVALAADQDMESAVACKAYLVQYFAGDNVTLATVKLDPGC